MLTEAGSWIRQATSSWVTSMESATICVLDGTNKPFWFAQEDSWRPKREQKGLQAESRHVIAIRGRSWSNFHMACNLSFLFDMKQ